MEATDQPNSPSAAVPLILWLGLQLTTLGLIAGGIDPLPRHALVLQDHALAVCCFAQIVAASLLVPGMKRSARGFVVSYLVGLLTLQLAAVLDGSGSAATAVAWAGSAVWMLGLLATSRSCNSRRAEMLVAGVACCVAVLTIMLIGLRHEF